MAANSGTPLRPRVDAARLIYRLDTRQKGALIFAMAPVHPPARRLSTAIFQCGWGEFECRVGLARLTDYMASDHTESQ